MTRTKITKWWNLYAEPYRESIEFPNRIPGCTSACVIGTLLTLFIYIGV